jgi:hypothetical protein
VPANPLKLLANSEFLNYETLANIGPSRMGRKVSLR